MDDVWYYRMNSVFKVCRSIISNVITKGGTPAPKEDTLDCQCNKRSVTAQVQAVS